MRILHFLDCTGHGGDALMALLLAEGQQRMGHSVQLIIERSEHSQTFLSRARARQVPAIEAAGLIHDGHQRTHQRVVNAWRALSPYAGEVLHMHTGGLLIHAADALAGRLSRFKIRVATIQSPFNWDSYPDPARYQRQWRLTTALLDRVLVPSRISVDIQLAAGLQPDKVKVLYDPVPVDHINAGQRSRLRRELKLGDADRLVLFLGRVDREKSPLEVIRAFGALAERFPRAFLAIAGSGKLEGACHQLIDQLNLQGRVFMLGYRTDTADLLRAADIFMQPSLWESFGMSLIEAMAAGLPVITTMVGVIPELEAEEQTVQLVAADDIPGMTAALEQLFVDSQLRQRLVARGLEVARRFDTSAVTEQHHKLYHSLLRSASQIRDTRPSSVG